MEYTINKLARMAGVSVRTLRFYDQTGLLPPARVGDNGYRYYGQEELVRLQQILFFRELKFPLGQIKEIMGSPSFDRREALEQQANLLRLEKRRLDRILKTIEKTITTMKGATTMDDAEFYNGLSREEVEAYAQEAKERWGNTEAYRQSQERWGRMSAAEKHTLQEDVETATQALADHMPDGYDSPAVQQLIDEQFKGINTMFYDCSVEMFRNLAVMTTQDERYAQHYRRFHPDLPEFRLRAVQYYCDRHREAA